MTELFPISIKHPHISQYLEAMSHMRCRRRDSLPGDSRACIPAYKHKPLPGRRFIRLLQCLDYDIETREIFAALYPVSLDDKISYNALSYTWGDALTGKDGAATSEDSLPSCRLLIAEWPMATRLGFDGEIFSRYKTKMWLVADLAGVKIGKNLSDFLLCLNDDRFRGDKFPAKDTLLWIDAVSIDQSSDIEKASQIPLMGEIYGNAQEVDAWLGLDEHGFEIIDWITSVFLPACLSFCFSKTEPDQMQTEQLWKTLGAYNPATREFWKDLNISEPRPTANSFANAGGSHEPGSYKKSVSRGT
ncbi:hypothetical protein D0Z07_5668 [Hyphodiscus hymeniophilus]|uniref:Heterokaryon incompatibility domain-containing protein n=1 Tax=Hyphodiscus hymeniophilus TaxID=353542 RepID=A0A9P7AVW4_9HELO|nr:hypothetical protein D0Z07_5668 [Hyphodiscus hymeniophilus]